MTSSASGSSRIKTFVLGSPGSVGLFSLHALRAVWEICRHTITGELNPLPCVQQTVRMSAQDNLFDIANLMDGPAVFIRSAAFEGHGIPAKTADVREL